MNLKVDVNLCRACLKPDIIEQMPDKTDLIKKFQYSTQLTIENNEPFNMCKRCITRLKLSYEFRRECLVSASYFDHLRACITKMNAELTQVAHTAMTAKLSVSDEELELLMEAGYKSEDIQTVLTTATSQEVDSKSILQDNLAMEPTADDETDKTAIDEEPQDYEDNYGEPDPDVDETMYQIDDGNCIVSVSTNQEVIQVVENIKIEQDRYMCLECNMQFFIKAELRKHMETHRVLVQPIHQVQSSSGQSGESHESILPDEGGSLADYICEHCGDAFESQEILDYHVKTHVENDDGDDMQQSFDEEENLATTSENSAPTADAANQCQVCGKTFSQPYGLTYHMRTHTDERPYECGQCGARFRQKGSLKQHTYIHTGEKPYKCELCDRGFTQSHSLTFHMRRHTGERPFVCDKCGNSFRQKESLKHHMLVHMDNRIGRKKVSVTDTNNCFTCEKCGSVFNKKGVLKQHMLIHTGEKPYTCGVCGRGFTQSHSLTFHARRHTGEKPYACDKCGALFRHAIGLKRHQFSKHSEPLKPAESATQSKNQETQSVSIQNKEQAPSIEIVPQANSSIMIEPMPAQEPTEISENANESQAPETDQIPPTTTESALYRCSICKAGFNTQAKYTEHMQTHDSSKPYKCEICGNGFTQNGSLKQHMLIHTGERPYKCEICGRGFTQGKSLTFHMRRHTGEKPFKCEICNLSFSLRDILKRHIQQQHSNEMENTFVCSVCLRVHGSQEDLDEHLQTHSKKYICHCGKSFVTKSSIRRHQKTHEVSSE